MHTASVSDLKNNLSARLKSVASGESLLVTDHRRPVALISPVESGSLGDELGSLVAAGIIAPPRRKLDVSKFLALPRAESRHPLSEAVTADRDGR